MANKREEPRSAGIGVDAFGGPVADPTKNVLDLVEAAIQRQDDLRKVESNHWREIWDLQRMHLQELRVAEKDRLDAIRHVDTIATNEATRAAELRADTLAKQTETMAETLRQQVAKTALESNTELKSALQPLMAAIEELRRWQYESAGQKQQVSEVRDVSGNRAIWLGLAAVVLFNTISIAIAVMTLT